MQDNIPIPIGEEQMVFQGKIIEVIHQRMKIGDEEKVFEFARRSPGVRLIITAPNGKLILTHEYRTELGDWDYRLPGGKVFDTLSEYNDYLKQKKGVLDAAKAAAIKEAAEEVGIKVKKIEYFDTSVCSSTIEWDLFTFIVNDYEITEQKLEIGESIELLEVSLEEAKNICLEGRMKQYRDAATLLRYLHKNNLL